MAALLEAPTLAAAARASGVSESTLRRWLASGDFRSEYDRRRTEMLDGAVRALQNRMAAAVDCLAEIMQDRSANPQTRLYAARSILEFAFRGSETVDILRRLEKLETAENDGFIGGSATDGAD